VTPYVYENEFEMKMGGIGRDADGVVKSELGSGLMIPNEYKLQDEQTDETENKNKSQESIQVFEKSEIIIGKSKNCDLQLKGWFIADQHCSIKKLSGGYVVEDLNRGANGTLVNNRKVDFYGPINLQEDCIVVGSYTIHLLEDDVEKAI
jgi:pSer/pThr/pTyr-binding forkhead associated (FHA) protein